MTYQQLTRDERYMIVQLRRQHCGLSEMARLMGRSRSTIWRELKRNMIQTRHGLGYCVSKAQEQRNSRLRRSRRGPQHSSEDYALVRRLLLQQWSPEQISGTLGRLNELQISHQTSYRYIRRDWRSGGDLWQELRRRYTNGPLRQYWPKRATMEKPSQRQCNEIAHKLNTRPRKRHGYISPLLLIT